MLVAVGGLFTSCIDNEEPLGVKELRYAKAEYIRALKSLTDANAEVAKAEAAYKLAQAEVEKAEAAKINAEITIKEMEAEGARLDNELKKIINDAKKIELELENAKLAQQNTAALELSQIENAKALEELNKKKAQIAADIAAIEDKAKVDSVKARKDLFLAEQELQSAIDSVAAYAMLLSSDESAVVLTATNAYLAALDAYETALEEWVNAQADNYINTYDAAHLSKDKLKNDLEKAKEALQKAKDNQAKYSALDGSAETWKAELAALEEEARLLELAKLALEADKAQLQAPYRMCFEEFREKIDALQKEYTEKYMNATAVLDAEVELPNHNEFIMNQWKDYTSPFVAGGILDFYTEDGKLYMTLKEEYYDIEGVLYSEVEPVGLKEIIETFKREKVIVDNEDMKKKLEDAQKAKKDADSIYFAHKAILEAGLMAYKPVADAASDLATKDAAMKAAKDAYDKAKADSVAAEKAAKTKYKSDTTAAGQAYKAAVKAANDAYDAAVEAAKQKQKDDAQAIVDAAKNFAYDINYFFGTIGGGDMDTTKVFPAIKKYAEFISQYNTPQDSIFFYNGMDADSNPIVGAKAIQDLTLEDMTPTGLLGKYAFVNNFDKTGAYGIPTDQIFAHVIRVLIFDKPFTKSTDINADILEVRIDGITPAKLLKDLATEKMDPNDPELLAALAAAEAARDAALADALAAYNTALADALAAYNAVLKAEHAKVADALAKYNAANAAVTAAQDKLLTEKNKFYEIYDMFWGYTAGTHQVSDYTATTVFTNPKDSLTVPYTEKTFVDPDDIVSSRVNLSFDALLNENEELAIVLYNFDRDGYTMTDYFNNPELSYIFFNDHYNEFADRFFAQALLNFYLQYETNLSTLQALEAAVNQLEDDYKAKKAEFEQITEDMYADLAAITGLNVEDIKEDMGLALEMTAAAYMPALLSTYTFDNFIDDFVDSVNGEYVYNNIASKMLWNKPYPVGGKILDIMKECMSVDGAGDFATKYAEWNEADRETTTMLNDLNNLIKTLDGILVAALELEALADDYELAPAVGTKYKALYEAFMEKLAQDVEDAEKDLYDLQKLYDTMEAGHDYLSVLVKIADEKIKLAEERYLVAKKQLEQAYATYKAVIDEYLNK